MPEYLTPCSCLTLTCSLTWLSSFGTKVGLYLLGTNYQPSSGLTPLILTRGEANVVLLISTLSESPLPVCSRYLHVGGGDGTVYESISYSVRNVRVIYQLLSLSKGVTNIYFTHSSGILKLSEILKCQSWPAQFGHNAGCRIERRVASIPHTLIVKPSFNTSESRYLPSHP